MIFIASARCVSRSIALPVILAALLLAGCSDGHDTAPRQDLLAARDSCTAAAEHAARACLGRCERFTDPAAGATCEEACSASGETGAASCALSLNEFAPVCGGADCAPGINECRASATARHAQCEQSCDPDNLYCSNRCRTEFANEEQACGFLPANLTAGSVALPALPDGKPADLNGFLDAAELAVVAAADERAAALRGRPIRLWTGAPATAVNVTQVEHAFRFGVPLDIREFRDEPGKLEFYGGIARPHTSLLVAETSLKWRNTEREEGVLNFDLADEELAWAEALGFDVKAHVLLWGNAPPLASGSGTPEWLRDRFPDTDLTDEEASQLRALIRQRIETVVSRYAGRIDVWEVTNEMLNALTPWFIDRLGPGIVDDAFRWARAADPGAELVYNEWISEIFTGVGGPDSVAVRDRILDMLAAGVPVDAVGQQGHFAPGLVNVGVDVDLSQRTRVDDYAAALDTLAGAGLPIHITEVTFAAPEEPEERAAQAEAIMRVWWGHPLVEEIIFWNFWNPLGPRSHLNLGVYDDDGNLSRHGEAIIALLNERWRTQVDGTTDARGVIELQATYGDYVAQWVGADGPLHVRFTVPRGDSVLDVVAVQ